MSTLSSNDENSRLKIKPHDFDLLQIVAQQRVVQQLSSSVAAEKKIVEKIFFLSENFRPKD